MIYMVLNTLWKYKGGRQMSLQNKISNIKIAPRRGLFQDVTKFVLVKVCG